MNILGINAYHGDSSACLVVDGKLLAAAEEERFRRIKHWAGLPSEAARYCLDEAGVSWKDVDIVAANRDTRANFLHKIAYSILNHPSASMIWQRVRNAQKVLDPRTALAAELGASSAGFKAKFVPVEHHRAHLASAFLVSPFEHAAVVSIDGFGDFASVSWGVGNGSEIRRRGQTLFPHSLGLFYLAMTQYLGFPNYGDEYKVMGLAAYGPATRMKEMRRIVRQKEGGGFELDLSFFLHHSTGVSMTWESGEPVVGRAFSPKLEEWLGPARKADEPLTDHHREIAASTQAMYEEAFFYLLKHVRQTTGEDRLCLAGGCAMNSVANGKISALGLFREIYIQAAAGDAGGAIGAAFEAWAREGGKRGFVMEHAYWGPSAGLGEMDALLGSRSAELRAAGCRVETIGAGVMEKKAAALIASGSIVGRFAGRMEWGPRALGNRSILGDPRRADMKDILNLKIKRRESFRPFAPSVLRECVSEWFEQDADVPFMMQVFPVRAAKRTEIPAVTHVDGSGRLQTVTERQNPSYYRLISEFRRLTGVPMVLNTSFNENEPIVCRPSEALDCFLRTKMDALILEDRLVARV